MTSTTDHDNGGIPRSFEAWERLLTRRYLEVGCDGDASPIRAFEVSPESLAALTGHAGPAAEAVAAFKAALRGPGLVDALEHGSPPPRRIDGCPGFLNYLILTLLVASLMDDDKGLAGDFRTRLKGFTGIDRSFNNLGGVARMWVGLSAWLEAKRQEGMAVRLLILPRKPETWVHIGYTRKLAFPSKSDAGFLTRLLHDKPALLDDPRQFVFAITTQIERGRSSDGLKEAFGDFREALDRGDHSLGNHHLWRFALSCAPSPDVPETSAAAIGLTYDEDGAAAFSIVEHGDGARTQAQGRLSEVVAAIGAEAIATLRQGFLVFRETGFSAWRTMDRLDAGPTRVLFACPTSSLGRLRCGTTRFSTSGGWSITSSHVPIAVADAFGASLTGGMPTIGRFAVVTVSDGLMVDGAWLGRPAFLPRISAGGEALRLRMGPGADGGMRIGQRPHDALSSALVADGPVAGTWIVEPVREDRNWSRRMTFVRNAPPRSPADGVQARFAGHEPITEWGEDDDRPIRVERRPSGWLDGDPRIADLVEALYAGGRSGWGESNLLALAHDAVGDGADPWHVIRSLRDASYVRPYLRQQWKGRLWGLEPLVIRSLDHTFAIVDGAPCEMLMDAFRTACAAYGAQAFRTPGATPLAPMLVGCTGGDLEGVSRRLGWPLRAAACCRGGRGEALIETKLTSRHRQPASRWDWNLRRFVADARVGEGEVALTRWSQADGRDHDVYVVVAGTVERRFVSRSAAVLSAHMQARLPLFSADERRITAALSEAALPDRVSMRLRLTHASNPGPSPDGFSYPGGTSGLQWLAGTLPRLVARPSDGARMDVGAMAVRHSNGRWRPTWIGGEMQPESAALRKAGTSGVV